MTIVKMQFLVTVEVSPMQEQDKNSFVKQDARAMKPYLMQKIREEIDGSWQYNASVDKVTVRQFNPTK